MGSRSSASALTDLNTLIPANSPYYLVFANRINDAGEIVGMAVDQRTGNMHAFLATPVPASSSASSSPAEEKRSPRWHIPEIARKLLRRRLPGSGVTPGGIGPLFYREPGRVTIQMLPVLSTSESAILPPAIDQPPWS